MIASTKPVGAKPIGSCVALGGGHGLYATLCALRELSDDVTAVVTVADDGGSSGRLRSELGVLPPGDLRMALAALAGDSPGAQIWQQAIQHRFGGSGALAGHSVGNLILAGLTEVIQDPVAALAALGRVLEINGTVLPMSPRPLDIAADVVGLEEDPRLVREIRGQVAVATTPGKVRRVRLIPADPPACAEATAAIESASVVVLGPGSWFTSVLPHVLVPDLLEALKRTAARRIVMVNLGAEPGETAGFSAERHLHVLAQHAPDLYVDDIVLDSAAVPPGRERTDLERAAEQFRARVHFRDVAVLDTMQHDPRKLNEVIAELAELPRPSEPPPGAWKTGAEAQTGRKETASWR